RTLLLSGTLLISQPVAAEHARLPDLTVRGSSEDNFSTATFDPETSVYRAPDAASAMQRLPGGSLNYNGQLSGQMQYRGLFGPRMNTRIDGMYINSGGPNWMDPPLHYLPASLVDSISVSRGIASVSTGSGIGGYVDAKTKSSDFTGATDFEFNGDVQVGGHSVDGGYETGGIMATANRNHRVHLLGSYENGDDIESGDGDIDSTDYRRSFIGLGYGFRNDLFEFEIEGKHVNSGPVGTPALPLDIRLFDSNLINSSVATRIGRFNVEARVFASDIDHRMSNFQSRPAPDFSALPLPPFAGADERFVNASGDGFGYDLSASTGFMGGNLSFGTDGHFAVHSATVSDPAVAAFFITNFNDAETNQHGFLIEWQNDQPAGAVGVEAGLRVNVVNTDAGFVNAFPAVLADTGAVVNAVTVGAQTLRNSFNATDRDQTDTNLDAVLKFNYAFSNFVGVELGFARKVRSPSYIERYLWIPLEVNAGLGDGNNYIGDPGLDPEKSHQVEFGLNLRTQAFYMTPRIFYRRVDDYIQGTATDNTSAITFSTLAAGDATPLVFSNVDAELYGFDLDAGLAINQNWRLDGTLSYTRGKRRDIDDDLFRIAPLNGRVSLTYSQENWSASIETVAFAEQHDVSDSITFDPGNAANNNESTPGYALLNLYADYQLPVDGLQLRGGIENALDEEYTDHLSGFNRNAASDVPIGQRLPGSGRNLYASMTYHW
ncbi:MAG: TonB-dependent receptor, partial [Thiotrichales bacterium]|nr:TonB-dependent receptor [Thiotrichales bacterium]